MEASIPAPTARSLCKARSEISQEVTEEMAPHSGAKLALPRGHDKAHMVLIPTNVTPDFKPKNEMKLHFSTFMPKSIENVGSCMGGIMSRRGSQSVFFINLVLAAGIWLIVTEGHYAF